MTARRTPDADRERGAPHDAVGAPPPVEPPALVRAAQGGDMEALSCLVSRYRETLVRFCRRLMGDAAAGEDLAQETLLRAQVSIGRLGPPYRFGPWLLGIAANLAKKAWRAEARRPLSWEGLLAAYPNVEWDESLTAVPSPERRSETAEEVRLLSDAIAALPRSLSDVLVLHYLQGLSYAEVAGALALPLSTVKGRLFESRSRLRRSLTACGMRAPAPHKPERNTMSEVSEPRESGANRVGVGDHLRVEVDVEEIVREAQQFLTARWPRPTPKAALDELATPRNRFLSIQVLESMVLDGASAPEDVRPFVEYCMAEWGLREHTDPALVAQAARLRARGLL
ncbi:MAG TPA: RNA polymerase sigma factor [Chloroflexota bacterium]|nr:RNA polymerase sigma factor [Chloroflexota bacterium]